MEGLIFAAVVLVAAGTWIARGLRGRRARAAVRRGPGTTMEQAIAAASFDAIDAATAARRCHCGAGLRVVGEGARAVGDRRFRHVRLECEACEDEQLLWFDVTTIFH